MGSKNEEAKMMRKRIGNLFHSYPANLANFDRTEQQVVPYANENKKPKLLPTFVQWPYATSALASEVANEYHTVFADFAADNDMVVLLRPLNKKAGKGLRSTDGGCQHIAKRLQTKGKSSEFDPIAGEIPVRAALSKLAVKSPGLIAEFEEKNQKALKKSAEIMLQIEVVTPAQVHELNQLFLEVAVVKKTEEGKVIYFVEDQLGNVVWNQKETSPLFLIANDADIGWLAYEESSKTFSLQQTLPNQWKCIPVEIMAYQQFKVEKMNGQEIVVEKKCPIISDYDELVSAPRKIFPLQDNHNLALRVTIDQSFFNNLYQSYATRKLDPVDVAAELIFRYEDECKREYDNIENSSGLNFGMVNENQSAEIAYLKQATNGAVNHGPEVNNPHPEKILPGEYLVYLPDRRKLILHDEQEICNFVNQYRALGFPIYVNSKWGWEIDNYGKLYIPAQRFPWEEVEKTLQQDSQKLEQAEAELQLQLANLGLQDSPAQYNQIYTGIKKLDIESIFQKVKTEFNSKLNSGDLERLLQQVQEISSLQKLCNLEKKMEENFVRIEKLRLEPDVIYSNPALLDQCQVSTEEGNKEVTMKKFINQVSLKVKNMEHEKRMEKMRKAEEELEQKEVEHYQHFRRNSIFRRGMEWLQQNRIYLQPCTEKLTLF